MILTKNIKEGKKEEDKKRKETRIAAANKITASIFAAECVKCKTLTEELFGTKRELERAERQLEDKEKQLNNSCYKPKEVYKLKKGDRHIKKEGRTFTG